MVHAKYTAKDVLKVQWVQQDLLEQDQQVLLENKDIVDTVKIQVQQVLQVDLEVLDFGV
jgi:hypothetical protein